MTTYGATSDDKVGITTTLGFQCNVEYSIQWDIPRKQVSNSNVSCILLMIAHNFTNCDLILNHIPKTYISNCFRKSNFN